MCRGIKDRGVNALMVSKQQALPGETRVQCLPDDNGLIIFFSPPVSGALGVIGISGRVCYKETNQALP